MSHGPENGSWLTGPQPRLLIRAPQHRPTLGGTMLAGDPAGAALGHPEAGWARMQTELLDRQRWKTRIELANAIFEYLEIFHNRQRRHSALGWRTPR